MALTIELVLGASENVGHLICANAKIAVSPKSNLVVEVFVTRTNSYESVDSRPIHDGILVFSISRLFRARS